MTPFKTEWLTVPVRRLLRSVGRRALRRTPAGGFGVRRAHFQTVVEAFGAGYEAALSSYTAEDVAIDLQRIAPVRRGFAYEGAAMALQLLDLVIPGRRDRFARFVAGPAEPFTYLAHVGAGWAAARLHLPPSVVLNRLDPLLGWLAVDGYGFHDGFFRPERVITLQRVPSSLSGYQRRAFDQGVGRSLWFTCGGEAAQLAATVARFDAARRGDLWSGVALAAGYAGGVGADELDRVRRAAAGYERELAQGAAFAAAARHRARSFERHTDEACAVFIGAPSAEVAGIVRALQPCDVQDDGAAAYEHWRTQVRLTLPLAFESSHQQTEVAV